MLKKVIVLMCLFLICACASAAKYEAALRTWRGASEKQLISQWGVPQQVYTSGESKYLVYSRSRSVYIPGSRGTQQTTLIGNTAYTHTYGATSPTYYSGECITTFELVEGKIRNYSFRGNDCVGY